MDIDLGRISPLFKGEYDADTQYELNDIVKYNGDLYWHKSRIPTTGVSPENTGTWAKAVDGGGTEFDIHALTTENAIADSDELPFYDASAEALRKTTWANIKAKLKGYFDTVYLGATALVGYATQVWVQSQGYGTYSKPPGGIPKTDLASDVQAFIDSMLEKVTKDRTAEYTNKAIYTNVGIGNTVDITGQTSTFNSIVVACKAGDKFTLTGTGGSAPRLWAFTDSAYKLLSVSTTYLVADELTLEAAQDGYFISNINPNKAHALTHENTDTRISQLADKVDAMKDYVDEVKSQMAHPRLFGEGIDCRYDVDGIGALSVGDNPLAYFYALYDELAETYPDYITKIDCDAEMIAAEIERPDELSDYPIYMYKFVPEYPSTANTPNGKTEFRKNKILITTGTHPEYTGCWDMYNTMKLVCEEWTSDRNLEALRFDAEYYIMPCSNPYGCKHRTRTNWNGVDLNRNMPTSNWASGEEGSTTWGGESAGSEYESKMLAYYMELLQPAVYIDHHNFPGATEQMLYITSKNKKCLTVGANYCSVVSRRWAITQAESFGNSGAMIGFCQTTSPKGTRAGYACEQGIYGFTYESCGSLPWHDGEYDDDNRETNTALVETLATDGFLNFLLCAFKYLLNTVFDVDVNLNG